MKRLLSVLMVFGVFLWSVGESFALPKCPGSPANTFFATNYWTNCEGILEIGLNKYVGEWKDGKHSGRATVTLPDGGMYIGEHKDNQRNGRGTYTYPDGEKYVGDFRNNKFHGQGTYADASGNKYIGNWKDGNKHGQGTYTDAKGANTSVTGMTVTSKDEALSPLPMEINLSVNSRMANGTKAPMPTPMEIYTSVNSRMANHKVKAP